MGQGEVAVEPVTGSEGVGGSGVVNGAEGGGGDKGDVNLGDGAGRSEASSSRRMGMMDGCRMRL